MSGIERRQYPRYKAPDVIAMARVPESTLDYYFKVSDMSVGGLALLTWTVEGFPVEKDRVLDLEVYSHLGSIRCRAVVIRPIQAQDGKPAGFGAQVYGMSDQDTQKWEEIITFFARFEQEKEES